MTGGFAALECSLYPRSQELAVQMDFARQNTRLLLQPDCRRAGRSHLIKANLPANSSSKIKLLAIAGGPAGASRGGGWGEAAPRALVKRCRQRRARGGWRERSGLCFPAALPLALCSQPLLSPWPEAAGTEIIWGHWCWRDTPARAPRPFAEQRHVSDPQLRGAAWCQESLY